MSVACGTDCAKHPKAQRRAINRCRALGAMLRKRHWGDAAGRCLQVVRASGSGIKHPQLRLGDSCAVVRS